uniref:Probable E3 ubiquitin-protein ligase RNF144A-A n=1 Tax=Cyprinodon variegatus TaxID=28743 RepID=A0A3Q2GG40_CYPVA
RRNMNSKPEKCYNPRDHTIPFTDKEDEFDCKARMSCGHVVTPMSLTKYCKYLLRKGESTFVCGQFGCNVEWPYVEVRKMALLTPEEMEYFETTMAVNAFKTHFDSKTCPGCKYSVTRKVESNLSVRCQMCTATKGRTYEFCWQCLREWKGPQPRTDRCDNEGCCNDALKTLRDCPYVNFEKVKGVTECPSIRACPTCGILVEHTGKQCKNITCRQCKVEFCFVCLKITTECRKAPKPDYYGPCSTGIAPRQTSIPVWQRN